MTFLTAFFRKDRVDFGVTNREIAILSIANSNREVGICAADISNLLEQETGKEPRLSTIYSTLLSLENKGLIRVSGEALPDKGGRKRKLFSSTEIGEGALELGRKLSHS